jgi:hypothetical protein
MGASRIHGVTGDRRFRARARRSNGSPACGAGFLDWYYATLVTFAVTLSSLTAARAHDHARPELNGWYQSLRSGKGPCCDGSDARRVDDADWESRDGHYRVRIDGEWVDVPREAVVDGPNRAGRAMVWPYYDDGHPKARCFMPGSMS